MPKLVVGSQASPLSDIVSMKTSIGENLMKGINRIFSNAYNVLEQGREPTKILVYL